MDKIDIIKKLMDEKLVAVIRAESKEQGIKIVDAVYRGGIKFLEVTMTVPGAVSIIEELTRVYKDKDVVIGLELFSTQKPPVRASLQEHSLL